jgi:hypothetical protein
MTIPACVLGAGRSSEAAGRHDDSGLRAGRRAELGGGREA